MLATILRRAGLRSRPRPITQICVDGVSLTVVRKTATTFVVSLVQFTQAHTTLLLRAPGEAVNIETDIMRRYLAQLVEARASENIRSGRRAIRS